MGITNKLGSRQTADLSATGSLLQSLIISGKKAQASALHVYLSQEANSCFFEIGSRLCSTGKKFSDKSIEELSHYIKDVANLEKSRVAIAQSAELKTNEETYSIFYLQDDIATSAHIVINLAGPSSPKSFDDLGFWGKSLQDLEIALDYNKGIIIVDSTDQYSIRSFIFSSLNYLKDSGLISSVSFDSSSLPSLKPRAHDRVFTKVDQSTKNIISTALKTNPSVVIFLDPADEYIISLALEQSRLGRVVFIVSSEGSSSASLNKTLAISRPEDLLQELRAVISLSPIQTIGNSNGLHRLNPHLISQLESFFGISQKRSWVSFYARAGIKGPEDPSKLELLVASEYTGLTNLVEVLLLGEYLKRTLSRSTSLSIPIINMLASKLGMPGKGEDGLIKALRKEVDLADVINICK